MKKTHDPQAGPTQSPAAALGRGGTPTVAVVGIKGALNRGTQEMYPETGYDSPAEIMGRKGRNKKR